MAATGASIAVPLLSEKAFRGGDGLVLPPPGVELDRFRLPLPLFPPPPSLSDILQSRSDLETCALEPAGGGGEAVGARNKTRVDSKIQSTRVWTALLPNVHERQRNTRRAVASFYAA